MRGPAGQRDARDFMHFGRCRCTAGRRCCGRMCTVAVCAEPQGGGVAGRGAARRCERVARKTMPIRGNIERAARTTVTERRPHPPGSRSAVSVAAGAGESEALRPPSAASPPCSSSGADAGRPSPGSRTTAAARRGGAVAGRAWEGKQKGRMVIGQAQPLLGRFSASPNGRSAACRRGREGLSVRAGVHAGARVCGRVRVRTRALRPLSVVTTVVRVRRGCTATC